MTIGLIFKRMRREWRSLSILALAVCMLTGFFALGPFYIRAVTEVGLRSELNSAAPEDLQINLLLNNEPLSQEALDVVREELGALAIDYRHYIRADYNPPTTQGGIDDPGLATGGYVYNYGDWIINGAARTGRTYQPFAFAEMDEMLTLVEGRWPVRLPPHDVVDPTGLPDAELQARQIGPYTRGEVEIIISPSVAEQSGREVGSRIVLGTLQRDGTGAIATAIVVGIAEAKDPEDPFWRGNRNYLEGANVEFGLGFFRFDFGLATIPEAYTDWLREVTPGNTYAYEIMIDPDVITADNIQGYKDRLAVLQNRLGAYHPGLTVLTGLTSVLDNYSGDVSEAEGPIILLSGAILVMLLYHLINTVALVLEQQGTEWSSIVSRGGSVPQLVTMQFVTMGLLGVAGVIFGPLLSIVFMHGLERFGPLATALGGQSLGSTNIPTVSIYLSIAAAVASVLVLSLPALPAARRSLLRLKQLVSRPPTKPSWARFALDFWLLVVGGAFMLRLYYMSVGTDDSFNFLDIEMFLRYIGGWLAGSIIVTGVVIGLLRLIAWLVSKTSEAAGKVVVGISKFTEVLAMILIVGVPVLFIIIAMLDGSRQVLEAMAEEGSGTESLSDPFSLVGPALLLSGLALLWLRFFPMLMNIVSGFFKRSRHLTTPLAVWNVARDPGHYAQLVLLLIITLALGTASLGLSETRDKGAWKTARDETGGSVRVEVNPAQLDAGEYDWEGLDGVSNAAAMMHVVGDPGGTMQRNVHLFGVYPDAVADAFPELEAALDPLRGVEAPPLPGLMLPDDAERLQVQVYSLSMLNPDDPGVTVKLTAYLQDALGVPYRILLSPPATEIVSGAVGDTVIETGEPPTPTDEWLTFAGNVPATGNAPYYLMRIGINSTAGNLDAFEHTVYMDHIATQDIFGTATALESFEDERNVWDGASVANPYAGSWSTPTTALSRVGGLAPEFVQDEVIALDGDTTMKLLYRMGRVGGRRREPSIVVNEPILPRLPVVINTAFADQFKGRSISNDPLTIGDQRNVILNVGTGSVELGYVVVGVIDGLPTLDDKDPLMITQLDLVRPVINQAGSSLNFFNENEIWFELPDRDPSGKLEGEIAALEGVRRAVWAWDRYGEIQREPLPSAVAGMLFAGFWISLLLSLLDFAFYLIVTARQRLFTFGVLRSLGWNSGHIWRLLFIEQVALIAPALLIGSLIGAGLAYLLLPFLALVGSETLRMPWLQLAGMLAILVFSFTALMGLAAIFLQRMSVNQVLRLGEE